MTWRVTEFPQTNLSFHDFVIKFTQMKRGKEAEKNAGSFPKAFPAIFSNVLGRYAAQKIVWRIPGCTKKLPTAKWATKESFLELRYSFILELRNQE